MGGVGVSMVHQVLLVGLDRLDLLVVVQFEVDRLDLPLAVEALMLIVLVEYLLDQKFNKKILKCD